MTVQTVLEGAGAVRDAVGSHLGYSDWITVTQEQIELFADATVTTNGSTSMSPRPPLVLMARRSLTGT